MKREVFMNKISDQLFNYRKNIYSIALNYILSPNKAELITLQLYLALTQRRNKFKINSFSEAELISYCCLLIQCFCHRINPKCINNSFLWEVQTKNSIRKEILERGYDLSIKTLHIAACTQIIWQWK